jgi:hypothetical protein
MDDSRFSANSDEKNGGELHHGHAGRKVAPRPGGFGGGFPRRISYLRGPPGMNSIGTYRTTRKISQGETVALDARFATMSDADRLIGGGAVGFWCLWKTWSAEKKDPAQRGSRRAQQCYGTKQAGRCIAERIFSGRVPHKYGSGPAASEA